MEVDISRAGIPPQSGLVDVAEVIRKAHPHKARVLDDVQCLLLPGEEWESPLPKACHMVPPEQEVLLFQKALQSGFAELISDSVVKRDMDGRPIVSGFYSVPHKANSDGLILDRRPDHARERRLVWVVLPSGACLCQVIMEADEVMRVSGDDLRTFFYQLLKRSSGSGDVVGRPLDGSHFLEFGGVPGTQYRLKVRVWGVGDHNACDVAQLGHVTVLKAEGCMRPEETLEWGTPAPAGKTSEGTYIDDHLVLQAVPEGDLCRTEGYRDAEIIDSSIRGYDKAGFLRSEEKEVRFQPKATGWGSAVDGFKGSVVSPPGAAAAHDAPALSSLSLSLSLSLSRALS